MFKFNGALFILFCAAIIGPQYDVVYVVPEDWESSISWIDPTGLLLARVYCLIEDVDEIGVTVEVAIMVFAGCNEESKSGCTELIGTAF